VEPLQDSEFHTGIFNTPKKFDVNYKYSGGTNLRITSKEQSARMKCTGTEGWIESESWREPLTASNPTLLEPLPEKKTAIPTDENEHVNFLKSIRSGEPAIMNQNEGHATSVLCHLGNIAIDLNRKLHWDAIEEKFIDDDEANAKRGYSPREKWSYEKILNMKC